MNNGSQSMEQELSEKSEEKKSLPPMPEDYHPFWRGAEKHVFTVQPSVFCDEGKHYFQQVSGTEIECKFCRIGYMISLGVGVRDGRIYLHGSRVG